MDIEEEENIEKPTRVYGGSSEFVNTLWRLLQYPDVSGDAVRWGTNLQGKPTVDILDMGMFIDLMNENRKLSSEWMTADSIRRAFYKYGFTKASTRQEWFHPKFNGGTRQRDLVHVIRPSDCNLASLSKRFDALHAQLKEETVMRLELLMRMRKNEELIKRVTERVVQVEAEILIAKLQAEPDNLLHEIQNHPDWEGVPMTPEISLTEEWTGVAPAGEPETPNLWCDEFIDITDE